MFVLLEHRTRDGVHWDFLVEAAGSDRLPTWRLAENPVALAKPIQAERIGDHRRVYLDFEGDIGGGRGIVRRLDRGRADPIHWSDTLVILQIAGDRLAGQAVLRRSDGDWWTFDVESGRNAAAGDSL